MKRILTIALAGALALGALSGCGTTSEKNQFDAKSEITVISREDGSGTRGAFVELMGVLEKGADGSKTDRTTKEATVVNSTDVVLTSVAGDPYAIGYISLGSLGDTVRALKVDGVLPSAEAIKDGSYAVARPFLIATKGTPKAVSQDFINYILSREGQAVVSKSYLPVNDAAADFVTASPSGKCVIAGSSSVSPIMEKLIEAYKVVNPAAELELQSNDSTAGMTAAAEGTCDIGMSSRALKDSELSSLTPIQIATDGIAIIVNPKSPVSELTHAQIKDIYTGAITTWAALAK